MSSKLGIFLIAFSVTMKWLFYLHLFTLCHNGMLPHSLATLEGSNILWHIVASPPPFHASFCLSFLILHPIWFSLLFALVSNICTIENECTKVSFYTLSFFTRSFVIFVPFSSFGVSIGGCGIITPLFV